MRAKSDMGGRNVLNNNDWVITQAKGSHKGGKWESRVPRQDARKGGSEPGSLLPGCYILHWNMGKDHQTVRTDGDTRSFLHDLGEANFSRLSFLTKELFLFFFFLPYKTMVVENINFSSFLLSYQLAAVLLLPQGSLPPSYRRWPMLPATIFSWFNSSWEHVPSATRTWSSLGPQNTETIPMFHAQTLDWKSLNWMILRGFLQFWKLYKH